MRRFTGDISLKPGQSKRLCIFSQRAHGALPFLLPGFSPSSFSFDEDEEEEDKDWWPVSVAAIDALAFVSTLSFGSGGFLVTAVA